jgi:hypothetical protein
MNFLREVHFICSLHNHQNHTVKTHASLTFLKNRNKTSELQQTVTKQTQQDSKWRAFPGFIKRRLGA